MGRDASGSEEWRLLSGFLDSGRVISRTANVAAILAGAGFLLPGLRWSRPLFALSILCWLAECWLAVRVAIDASLCRAFEADPERAGRALDDWMARHGLRRARLNRPLLHRTTAERSRGALLLWRWQIGAFAVELATLLTGGILAGWII
jgi:hypothetical protein